MLVRFRQSMGEFHILCNWVLQLADQRVSTINLTKNSQFYVRQGDVERLITQGYLQKLS